MMMTKTMHNVYGRESKVTTLIFCSQQQEIRWNALLNFGLPPFIFLCFLEGFFRSLYRTLEQSAQEDSGKLVSMGNECTCVTWFI